MTTRITVSPNRPNLDDVLRIRVEGLPRRWVLLRAREGTAWSSWAEFAAPDNGVLDLTEAEPVDGTYDGIDPMGLIWSMAREPGTQTTPLVLTAEIDGQTVARHEVHRQRVPDNVTRAEVRTNGLVGVLFTPKDGPAPGVVLLGGSAGGLHETDAALLAGHGFSVLALAYFGLPGVPEHLVHVPLEYFGAALLFLADHESVRGKRSAVIGGSFGGVAALLIGSMFPEVSAVVSIAGGGVLPQGIDGNGDFHHMLNTEVAPFTWRGEPLPFIANPATPEMRLDEPVPLRLAFEQGMRDEARLRAATIAVERIQGPVLLISAGDDRQFPAEAMSDIALARLENGRHLRFPAAGHGICVPPFRPTTETVEAGPGVRLALGGTPAATAAAQHAAWRAMIDFLSTTA